MKISELNTDYNANRAAADAFLTELLHQFSALVKKADIKLGLPLEGRIKEWSSISEKVDRKSLDLTTCKDLNDFIGIRAITLFKRDVTTLCKLIEKTFIIKDREDKSQELENSKFGYISQHYVIRIPKSWKKIPAFSGLDFNTEIQVRTLSQHIWAASSHVLQYKKEADVPDSVSRSIHRVAALLETVDLEFERVLEERDDYSKSAKAVQPETLLDTDNLQRTLKDLLPPQNWMGNEVYSELLSDLHAMNIKTVSELKILTQKQLKTALLKDSKLAEEYKNNDKMPKSVRERAEKGILLNHVGLARTLLSEEFNKVWTDYQKSKNELKKAPPLKPN